MVPCHDGSDDAHPGEPRNVRDHVVQLHVHLHERLLHELNVRGGIVDQPLAMAQVRAQTHDAVAGSEAPAQQPVLVDLLQPLRIVHIRLPAGDVLDVARVDQQHLEATDFENLKDRNPVPAGRLHRDRRDAHGRQPIRQLMEIATERAEGTDRSVIAVARYGDHVKGRAAVDAHSIWMDRGKAS
jgi:hypothetical protein